MDGHHADETARLTGPRISVPLFVVAAVFTGLAGIVAVLVALVLIAAVTARRR